MAAENNTRVPESKDAPVAKPVPEKSPEKSLHDPVQSMRDLMSLLPKGGFDAASLQNLATELLYGTKDRGAKSSGTTGDGRQSLAHQAGSGQQDTAKHDVVKGQYAFTPKEIGKPQEASTPVEAASKQQEIVKEHKRLSDWADHNLKEPKLAEFKKNMDTFEARAKQDGLDPDEVLKTYKDVSRLNDAKGDKPLSEIRRQKLAQQIVQQSAEPNSIDQGLHNTCSAATVEVRTYTRNPSAASRLVTDVALTGEYRAADGTHIKVDPQPHDESRADAKGDGERTHASEIFQVTALNLFYAKENKKNGTKLHYEQVTPAKGDDGDTGERLIDYAKHPPQEMKIDKQNVRQPLVPDNAVTDMSNTITGKNEKNVQIDQSGYVVGDTKGMIVVNSEAEFSAKLKELKDTHQLPAIVKVSSFNEPFNTDSFGFIAGGESGGAHVVNITDYDEKTGKVTVDNQWGKNADHGKHNPISVHDMYIAMQTPQDAEKSIAADVKYNKEHGIKDPVKEIELKRYQAVMGGENGESIGVTSVRNSIDEMQKRWKEGGVSDEEKAKERKALSNLISAMPIEDQVKLARAEHQAHISSDSQYQNQLAFLGMSMANPTDKHPTTDQMKDDFKAALNALSNEQQIAILKQIDIFKNAMKHPHQQSEAEKEIMKWYRENEGK